MQKISTVVVAAVFSVFLLTHPASASKHVTIHGTHDYDEIKDKCDKAGGDFTPGDNNSYSCTTNCHGGSGDDCGVSCNHEGKCGGWVPGRIAPKRTRVDDLLTRTVKKR